MTRTDTAGDPPARDPGAPLRGVRAPADQPAAADHGQRDRRRRDSTDTQTQHREVFRQLGDELSALLKEYEMANEVSHGQFGLHRRIRARTPLTRGVQGSHDAEGGDSPIPLARALGPACARDRRDGSRPAPDRRRGAASCSACSRSRPSSSCSRRSSEGSTRRQPSYARPGSRPRAGAVLHPRHREEREHFDRPARRLRCG
jgi:hypothetical protein